MGMALLPSPASDTPLLQVNHTTVASEQGQTDHTIVTSEHE